MIEQTFAGAAFALSAITCLGAAWFLYHLPEFVGYHLECRAARASAALEQARKAPPFDRAEFRNVPNHTMVDIVLYKGEIPVTSKAVDLPGWLRKVHA